MVIQTRQNIKPLSKILECEPDEIFVGEILNEIEEEFLNEPKKEMSCIP